MIASITGGRTIVVTPMGDGYRVTAARINGWATEDLHSSIVTDAEELADLLDRALPGEVTVSVCMTCGRAYQLCAGGVEGLPVSHGLCSEGCAGVMTSAG
jgi:hypothetical protein